MVSKPLSDTRPYQEKQNEQARDSGSTDNPGNNRENEGLLMMAEFEREIAAQGGGGGVPPLPPKKNSRGSSIGDLLASVAKSAVNVVQDFEQNPTPPSSLYGGFPEHLQATSRQSPDAAAGVPSDPLAYRSHLNLQTNMPAIKSQVELSTLSPPPPFQTSLGPPLRMLVGSTPSLKSSSNAYSANTLILLGLDISNLPKHQQYLICAGGVFFFTLIYGFFQELVVVKVFDRQLPLFLAFCQFAGYTCSSAVVHLFVNKTGSVAQLKKSIRTVPYHQFFGMAALRSFDLGMTNSSMRYVNYPVKTLMKSSRVVFTMLFGSIIMRKRHRKSDYVVVSMMVSGLAFFIHAETTAKDDQHTFSFVGIGMLVLALLADGAVVNLNEKLMNVHGLGQDEMIFMLYSLATSIMFIMTLISGQLWKGLNFLLVDGPMMEASISYTSKEKLLGTLAFVMMGFLGSSCAGAITKHFGALSMSITSTARKATTLFLSFILFPKVCTFQHILGMAVFVLALVVKTSRSFLSRNNNVLPLRSNSTPTQGKRV